MKNKSYSEREVVGYFRDMDAVQTATDALLKNGIDKTELSVLTSAEDAEEKLGDQFGVETIKTVDGVPEIIYKNRPKDLAGKLSTPANLMYIGELMETAPVILSGGTLAAGLVAGLAGSGKTIKNAFEKLVGWEHAKHIEHELKAGGVLLWVRVWNKGDERRVSLILEQNSGKNVHVHRFAQAVPPNMSPSASDAVELSYLGVAYSEAGAHEYYVSGKLFASEGEAKDYIRRHSYVEKLHNDAKIAKLDLEGALADPIAMFHTPAKLMAADLPDALKYEFLNRWAFYERELESAADDGMLTTDNPGEKLQEIDRYLEALKTG